MFGSELDAPESNGLIADRDAAFGEKILDLPAAQIESAVQPDGIGNNIWRESVTLVCNHPTILAVWGQLTCQYPRLASRTKRVDSLTTALF
jgi:hypothetical protein